LTIFTPRGEDAAEQMDAADEAGASDGASPLIHVLSRQNDPVTSRTDRAVYRLDGSQQVAHLDGMSARERGVDWNKVDELTLALLYLTSFQEHGAVRSWKGHDWDVLNRLHERGWISNPVSKAKSVLLTEEGARRSRELFEKHFGVAAG
jgi:hypothetical protein